MAATTPKTYTGEDAAIEISGQSHSVIGMGDFSLDISRGSIETELVGEAGNWFGAGAISIEGSFTNTQWANDVMDATVGQIINGDMISVSGSVGDDSLSFYFHSAQITGFDITLGDASTVTEGSIDFTILDPYNLTSTPIDEGGVHLSD